MPDRSDEIFLLDADRLRPLPVRPMRLGVLGKTLEDALQSLLQNYPQIIPGKQIDPISDKPPRFVLLRREMPVGGYSLDHLYVDQRAILTLVQTELIQNPESRREVIGQSIEYAANACELWEIGQTRQCAVEFWSKQGKDLDEILRAEFEDLEIEAFWKNVEANLKAGRIRIIVVTDELRPEVRRMIEYLNKEMKNAEILGLEIKCYGDENVSDQNAPVVLMPRLVGTTKPPDTPPPPTSWPPDKLRAAFEQTPDEQLRKRWFTVLDWASNKKFFMMSTAHFPGYLDFFKFKKNPFHITPDPDFLFLSPSHKEASASIFYGIEERKGFVAVTGEVGVGKTTILRSYLEGMDPEKIRIVYIFNAAVSFDKLLKQILSELGVQSVDGDAPELVDSLFRYLIDEYKSDRNVVLIIDEAQNMPVETLERLRMLSNLETSQDKLLQIIMAGQPELEDRLNLPELRQLKQRIAIRCQIAPLTPNESLAYIQHRLMKASLFHNPVFTKDALKRIVKEANGIPRIINILCDNALVTAFGHQRNPVDVKIIKEVIGDFQGRQQVASFNWKVVWVPALVVLIGLAVYAGRDFSTSARIRTLEKVIFSAGVSGPSFVAEPAKQPQEVKPAADTPPAAEPGPAVVEVKPVVAEPPESEQKPALAGVGPAAVSPPGTEPEPAVPVVKPAVETAPGAEPEPVLPKAPATEGDRNVSEKMPENAAVPAWPSMGPQAAPQPLAGQSPKRSSHIHVVKKGDTVGRLLTGTTGRVDEDLIKAFKGLNPQIKNIDIISEGEELALPGAE